MATSLPEHTPKRTHYLVTPPSTYTIMSHTLTRGTKGRSAARVGRPVTVASAVDEHGHCRQKAIERRDLRHPHPRHTSNRAITGYQPRSCRTTGVPQRLINGPRQWRRCSGCCATSTGHGNGGGAAGVPQRLINGPRQWRRCSGCCATSTGHGNGAVRRVLRTMSGVSPSSSISSSWALALTSCSHTTPHGATCQTAHFVNMGAHAIHRQVRARERVAGCGVRRAAIAYRDNSVVAANGARDV